MISRDLKMLPYDKQITVFKSNNYKLKPIFCGFVRAKINNHENNGIKQQTDAYSQLICTSCVFSTILCMVFYGVRTLLKRVTDENIDVTRVKLVNTKFTLSYT